MAVGKGAVARLGLKGLRDLVPPRPLRVGFPPQLLDYPAATGVGKMWQRVLGELAADVDLVAADPRAPRARRPSRARAGIEVWLHDGHQGPLPVNGPVVAELHEASWHLPETRRFMDEDFVATYERPSAAAATAATRIVTLSESSRRQITDAYGVAPERVIVAPLGVDHTVFHPGAGDPRPLIAAAGGDPARPYVLFVSQLHPRKNLEALREAMALLAGRGQPHQLVIVGGPPVDRAESAELVRGATAELRAAPGRVVYLSQLDEPDVARLMTGAAAFCLPSFMEGFGLTVLEAMACAAPVVVSDRGPLPEVVGDAGVVTAPDPRALAVALESVLADPVRATALRRASVARSARFTWKATAAHWRRAIDEAARAGNAPSRSERA